MPDNGRLKIGVYWAASCGGCDVSVFEIGFRILDLLQIADVVFWPCAADFKYADVAAYPDAYIDVCLFNGGIRNTEQEEVARLLRKKSRTLVAYGACAADGGIPALANLSSREALFQFAYHDSPSTENPGGVEPQVKTDTPFGQLEIPDFYSAVLRLKDVVSVDYEIPGCPPQADRVWEVIQAVAGGAVPANNGALRVGCTLKSVCDECPLEKRLVKITQFRRHHEFRPEPGWCLLEQGQPCMGPATRGGCGALCLKAGMRCEGCYGPPVEVTDQGTAITGAIGALLDAQNEKRAGELIGQIPDPAGTFYRFSMASSHMKARR
ncbi:MAG: oxidoreductase [Bryobacteraceae bacterium]|nr:oxidoreductase [Bryobacteraceae bacterium]